MAELYRLGFNSSFPPVAPSRVNQTLNSATTWVTFRVIPPATLTLDAVVIPVITVTGSVTGIGIIRIETDDGTGKPSGSLATGAVEETFTPSTAGSHQLQRIVLTNKPSLTAATMYHVVFKNGHATPASNNYAISYTHPASTVWPFNPNTTTSGTWSTYQNLGGTCTFQFTDGTVIAPSGSAYADTNATAPSVYGTGGSARQVRWRIRPTARLKITGFIFQLLKIGTPSDLTITVKDGSGNSYGSVTLPVALVQTSARNMGALLSPAIVLPPNLEAQIIFTTSSGDSSNQYQITAQTGNYIVQSRSIWNTLGVESSTNGGSTWADISVSSLADAQLVGSMMWEQVGDFDGWGTLDQDSSTRDGGSGSSMRMQSTFSYNEFLFRRYYLASATGSKTYAIKIRRDSTDIPTTLEVRLIKVSDGSTLATLTADSSANDAFFSYSSSVSLTSGDVVEIRYVVKRAAANTNGYGWFDTESWT
jgi:hypothetical protein